MRSWTVVPPYAWLDETCAPSRVPPRDAAAPPSSLEVNNEAEGWRELALRPRSRALPSSLLLSTSRHGSGQIVITVASAL